MYVAARLWLFALTTGPGLTAETLQHISSHHLFPPYPAPVCHRHWACRLYTLLPTPHHWSLTYLSRAQDVEVEKEDRPLHYTATWCKRRVFLRCWQSSVLSVKLFPCYLSLPANAHDHILPLSPSECNFFPWYHSPFSLCKHTHTTPPLSPSKHTHAARNSLPPHTHKSIPWEHITFACRKRESDSKERSLLLFLWEKEAACGHMHLLEERGSM